MNKKYEIYTKDFLKDGNGVRSTRKFLQTIIKLFAEESFQFYDYWGEFPFIYSEKQVNSVVIPAIHKYTNNIWLEQPFKKTKGNQRFLDIATTKGKNIYLIELKHSWNSKNNNIAKYTDNEWEKAIEQIKDINRETIGNYFNYEDYNIFKIALMVMPTYISNKINHNILNLSALEYTKKLIYEYQQYLDQNYQANFIGTIKITNPLKYEHEFLNMKQLYPFISFIAKIEKI
jgi:hypothetical protein